MGEECRIEIIRQSVIICQYGLLILYIFYSCFHSCILFSFFIYNFWLNLFFLFKNEVVLKKDF